MKAIILSANKPVFSDQPVFDIDILEHKLIDIQVSILRNSGIEDIHIVLGHAAESFARSDIHVHTNPQWQQTGSAFSLAIIIDALSTADDDILVVYGDTLFESQIIKELMKSREDFTACCMIDDQSAFNEKVVIENGLINRVSAEPDSFFVFTGLLLIRQNKLKYVRSRISEKSSVGDLLNSMSHDGEKIITHIIKKGWMELRSQNSINELAKNSPLLSKIIQIHVDWTQRAKKYNNLDWVNRDVLMSGIVQIAKQISPGKILDLGTGTGKVLKAIKNMNPTAECWGVDYSQAMLEKVENKESYTLKVSNAEDLKEIPSDYFDLVTARMVFHHINNLQKAASEVKRILKKGGCFILCEGNPPSQRTIKWYTEMFRYKEDRYTLTEVDLINILVYAGFQDITTKTIIMPNCSLNNWLDNSGIPQENIDIIKKMHYEADDYVREDYRMATKDSDCFMDWKFSITFGFK